MQGFRRSSACHRKIEEKTWQAERSADMIVEVAMNQTLDLPILGLQEDFPETLFVLHHPSTDRYGCYCHDGVHGLACFSTEAGAFRFAEWIDLSGMASIQLNFDEAREVAKARPMPVVSLMLLDKMENPSIHFVR